MAQAKKIVFVAIMGERWDSDRVRVEFETAEDRQNYVKAFLGVFRCYEAYSEWVKA